MSIVNELQAADWVALVWFVACWLLYAWLADNTRLHRHSVSAAMAENRKRWMRTLLTREMRMVDTTIQGNLIQGVAFFASTTILIVAGVFALLGATDTAVGILADLPLAAAVSTALWEVKVLLLLVIFIYAFFKFAWALRLFNYCSIMIGGAPECQGPPDARALAYADRMAVLNGRAAHHFNRGVRAYFFALAATSWFLHPYVFLLVTTWVTLVLQRREFHSIARLVMLDAADDATDSPASTPRPR